jgi:hypothetical protein
MLLKTQSSTEQKPTQSIQRKKAQLNEYPSYPHNTFSWGSLNVDSSIAFAVFQAVAL